MAVKIRLRRMGKRNAPAHRVVVTDGRKPRDGRFIELVGTYNPRLKQETIDLERVDYWISRGAKPSDTVDAIIKRARAGISFGGSPKNETAEPAEQAPADAEAVAPEATGEETETEESSADAADNQAAEEPDAPESADDDQDKK